MTSWAFWFAVTQLVEVPIYAALARERFPGLGRRAALGFGASAITHPFVWFVFPLLVPHSYLQMVIAAEAFAVLIEAGYWRLAGLRAPLHAALIANGMSVAAGGLLRFLAI